MRAATTWSCLGAVVIAVACGSASDEGLNAGSGNQDASAGSGGTPGSGGGASATGGTSSSTGGSSASGGAGSGGQSDASTDGATSCVSSLDCVGDPNGKTICDSAAGRCVECLSAPDCGPNHDCTTSGCVAYTPCESSTDCAAAPQGTTCDTATNRCVECVETTDCGANEACVGNQCRAVCDSDNDCTPQGLLCDTVSGACVECLNHAVCRAEQHCSGGRCVDDVCQPGTTFCEGTAVRACTDAGDGLGDPVACPEACNAGACVSGTGGSGGSGGTGGGSGCVASACPSPCAGLGPCCTRSGVCGCTNFPFLICL